MVQPTIQKGATGADKDWKLVWSDEFTGNSLNMDRWRHETIDLDNNGKKDQAAQHAANTYGIDENGNVKDGFPLGKRHAAWYNKHHDKTSSVKNGQLVLGGYVSDERDLTMKDSHHPYHDKIEGKDIDLRKKVYTSWIDTFALGYRDGAQRPNPAAPNQYWRGGYFEFSIDFSKMQTPGFRVSAWLMPAVDPDKDPNEALVGKVYDNIAKNGLEIDLFEYEPAPNCEQLLLMKTIGGNGPSDKAIDASKFGFDLTKGVHIIGLLWEKDKLVWFLNGVEVNRDTDHVPWVASAFYFTREMNTGIGSNTSGKPSVEKPYVQWDAGLFGRNVGAYLDKINNDKVYIDYLRVWQDPSQSNFNWISPHDLGIDGSSNDATQPEVGQPSTPAPSTPDTKPTEPSGGGYMWYDGEYLHWQKNGIKKWNVNHGTKYAGTVHEPKYKPTESGNYSVSEIDGKKIGPRSANFKVEVGTGAPVVEPPKPTPAPEPTPEPTPAPEPEQPTSNGAGIIASIESSLKDLKKLLLGK